MTFVLVGTACDIPDCSIGPSRRELRDRLEYARHARACSFWRGMFQPWCADPVSMPTQWMSQQSIRPGTKVTTTDD